MRDNLHALFTDLIRHLESPALDDTCVVRSWSPIPYFGDVASARVATVGLNPSNRAFEDKRGEELRGEHRWFHTLTSLNLRSWAEASDRHIQEVRSLCDGYFRRKPYSWFNRLNTVISGLKVSYGKGACHLDLVAYATAKKWSRLDPHQQDRLLFVESTLERLLLSSPIKILVLNGGSVVKHFQYITRVHLEKRIMRDWSTKRKEAFSPGYAYTGILEDAPGRGSLDRRILVMGFNHNLQGTFGVTTAIVDSIRDWISQEGKLFLDSRVPRRVRTVE